MQVTLGVDVSRWGRLMNRNTITAHLALPLIVFVTCFGFWVGTAGSRLTLLGGVLAALAALSFYAAFLWGSVVRSSRRLVVRSEEGRLVVPGSRVVAALFLVGLFAGLSFAIPLGLAAYRDGYDGSWIGLIVALGLPLLGAPVIVGVLRGRYRLNALELGPETVTYHSYNTDSTLAWSEVESVSIHPDPGASLAIIGSQPPSRVKRSSSLAEKPVRTRRGHEVEVGALLITLASGGAMVAELVEFYRTNPKLRFELGTDAAVDRIRRGQFAVGTR